jgi:hypothetical protein
MFSCAFSVSLARRLASQSVIFAACVLLPASAYAYRPFDGTDADVAKPGTMEIELQPVGLLRDATQTTLFAPATVVNIGLSKEWEAVFEARGQWPLSPSEEPASLAGAGAFLKTVLRPGSLQDMPGPSVATEFGVLLPGVNAEPGVGLSAAAIVSERGDAGAVHFNIAAALTREQRADLLLGTIVEGPAKWTIRPVAEVFVEEEFGQARTISALIGAIWQVREDLSFDIGLRHAITNGLPVYEVRAGLTVGFPLPSFAGAGRK